MATKKVTVTAIVVNQKPTTVAAQTVDTEVIDGNVVAEGHAVNPGVVYSNQK
jgi:hypothetical protein